MFLKFLHFLFASLALQYIIFISSSHCSSNTHSTITVADGSMPVYVEKKQANTFIILRNFFFFIHPHFPDSHMLTQRIWTESNFSIFMKRRFLLHFARILKCSYKMKWRRKKKCIVCVIFVWFKCINAEHALISDTCVYVLVVAYSVYVECTHIWWKCWFDMNLMS